MAAPHLFTTLAGAQRLGAPAEGLAPGQSSNISKQDGATLRITATPAGHGPAGIELLSGDVIGFVVSFSDGTPPLYVTGDTVWYDGVAEVARRFRPGVVLLFAGAGRTRGPFNLTMNTNDAIETAHTFPDATIVPTIATAGRISRKAGTSSSRSGRLASLRGCDCSNPACR